MKHPENNALFICRKAKAAILKPVLVLLAPLLLALGVAQPLQAQDKEKSSPLITFRQKLLSQKRNDNIEKIDSFSKLHLMIAGNVYQTEKHAAYAYDKASRKYDYKSEFKYIQPLLNLGDVTLVNLKTSFSNNTKNMFSSPDEFGLALKYAGVNGVMQANVHTANISKANMKRTQQVLDDYDIYHTGAFTDIQQRNGNFPLIINRKGFRIAVLNYTNLVARPSVSREFVINEIDKSVIDRDMRMARAYKPDFTIVYFDWGANTQEAPSYAQQELAQYVFQAGASLVVGTHPNTPMRLETMNYSYNGEQHEGIIAYSLGNLLGSNEELRNRNGFLIDMELQKNNFTRETNISDWGVIPVYTYYDTTSIRGTTKVFSVPCANIESADIFPGIPYIEKRRAVNSAYEVRKLLGTVADEIQYNLNELIVNNVMESIDITNAPLNNKYNPKREEEVKPSDAPELPVAIDNSYNTPSLALLYEEQPAQARELASAGAAKPATTAGKSKKEADKSNSYLKQRQQAEAIMTGEPVKENAVTEEDAKSTVNGSSSTAGKTETAIAAERPKATAISVTPVAASGISTADGSKNQAEIEMQKVVQMELDRDTFYRIQFYALKTYIPLDTNYYTHLKGYDVWPEDGLFKYMLGKFTNYEECENYWRTQIQPRYKQSFIVKFVDGKKILK